MFTFMVGACMFGYVTGNIASTMASLDYATDIFNQKMDSIKDYMRYRQFPRELSFKVRYGAPLSITGPTLV